MPDGGGEMLCHEDAGRGVEGSDGGGGGGVKGGFVGVEKGGDFFFGGH